MTDFKVTVGIREIKVKADDLNDAADKAIERLAENVASVTVVKIAPNQIGFGPPDDRAADG